MYLKRFFISILMFCITVFVADAKKFTVILDPGHGGNDSGATRNGVRESNINLAVALFVGEMLAGNSDIDVVYTRKTDQRLEPSDRMNTAINADGDIYVSIHTNAAYNEQQKKDVITTSGVEVYIIEQFDKNKERSENVLKKNSTIISINEKNEDVERKYNSSSPLSDASFKLKQQQIYNQSSLLALNIQREMGDENRNTRGILQKSLFVTWQTPMPSVLVEVGYITNPAEREFLTSASGQKSLARGIYNGIMAFKKEYVSRSDAYVPQQPTTAEPQKQTEQPKVTVQPKTTEQPKSQQIDNQVVYRWQIMTSKERLKENDARFKDLKNCQYYVQDNIYKYTYGESADYQEIVKIGTTVKKLFPDAFIITMKNGERIK